MLKCSVIPTHHTDLHPAVKAHSMLVRFLQILLLFLKDFSTSSFGSCENRCPSTHTFQDFSSFGFLCIVNSLIFKTPDFVAYLGYFYCQDGVAFTCDFLDTNFS